MEVFGIYTFNGRKMFTEYVPVDCGLVSNEQYRIVIRGAGLGTETVALLWHGEQER